MFVNMQLQPPYAGVPVSHLFPAGQRRHSGTMSAESEHTYGIHMGMQILHYRVKVESFVWSSGNNEQHQDQNMVEY